MAPTTGFWLRAIFFVAVLALATLPVSAHAAPPICDCWYGKMVTASPCTCDCSATGGYLPPICAWKATEKTVLYIFTPNVTTFTSGAMESKLRIGFNRSAASPDISMRIVDVSVEPFPTALRLQMTFTGALGTKMLAEAGANAPWLNNTEPRVLGAEVYVLSASKQVGLGEAFSDVVFYKAGSLSVSLNTVWWILLALVICLLLCCSECCCLSSTTKKCEAIQQAEIVAINIKGAAIAGSAVVVQYPAGIAYQQHPHLGYEPVPGVVPTVEVEVARNYGKDVKPHPAGEAVPAVASEATAAHHNSNDDHPHVGDEAVPPCAPEPAEAHHTSDVTPFADDAAVPASSPKATAEAHHSNGAEPPSTDEAVPGMVPEMPEAHRSADVKPLEETWGAHAAHEPQPSGEVNVD